MKKFNFMLLVLLSIFFIGCGGSKGSSDDTTEVKVVDTTALLASSNLCTSADKTILSIGIENSSDVVSYGEVYTNSCDTSAVFTQNHGIEVKSLAVDATNTKVAIVLFDEYPNGFTSTTLVPKYMYVKNSSDKLLARIAFQPLYSGDEFFLSVDGVIYRGNLETGYDDTSVAKEIIEN